MKKEIIIIGGGIIGLSCAYFLKKSGHQVTVIDASKMDAGASYINAGYLAPSHLIPLAAPGVMKQGIKWMLSDKSPLYIKPRLDLDFLKWSWAFNNSCTQKHVNRAAPVMGKIAILGQELFHQIRKEENFQFQLETKGLLMLCQSEEALYHEGKLASLAVREGLQAKIITATEVQEKMPDTTLDIVGAAYFECDHHTTPREFMNEMKAFLKNEGVIFRQEERVIDLGVTRDKITSVLTDNAPYKADEVVLAAGSWSNTLSRKLNLNISLQAGKGYAIETRRNTGITYPSILSEAKIAITPMNGFTRFAGTMEIAGINHKINKNRVAAIAEGVQKYFPKVSLSLQEKAAASCGLRPVSPDGMPYIGKSKHCKNLTIATGHAMMGWSLGPATGKLVQQIIDGEKTSIDTDLFNPDRKF